MKILKLLYKLDKKFALTFILGLFFGAVTVYTGFFYTRKPKLEFEIISKTSIIEVHEDLPKLKIYFKNKNILENKEKITLFVIRLINQGTVDINEGLYSTSSPLGLIIKNGNLIEKPKVLGASRNLLINSFNNNVFSDNKIILDKMLINSQDALIFKILVLHKEDESPIINSEGEISGQDSIPVIDSSTTTEKTFWEEVWDGNILIYIARWFFYTISLIMLFFLILLPITFISERIEVFRRKKIISIFKQKFRNYDVEKYFTFYNLYIENGDVFLKGIIRKMNSQDKKESKLKAQNTYDYLIYSQLQIMRSLAENYLKSNNLINSNGQIESDFTNFFIKFQSHLTQQ
ncbi:hypothetical protein [Leptospira sp. 'Mane']|uniref:hypothetical protein n=1 Tax=Leptospira sp. 'Mane' TaxID=3387407 RepID=UPI00398BB52A